MVDGSDVYFTTVDGHVVIADLESFEITRVVDLHELTDSRIPLGWCRGILPMGDSGVIVGFTRLRRTRWRDNINWVRNRLGVLGPAGELPTRITAYDLDEKRLLWDMNLEDHGLNTIFSVHPHPSAG